MMSTMKKFAAGALAACALCLALVPGAAWAAVDPEAVLIGGGVSKAGQILLDAIVEPFQGMAFHACKDTKILLASLGNDAGIYGGVRLILD